MRALAPYPHMSPSPRACSILVSLPDLHTRAQTMARRISQIGVGASPSPTPPPVMPTEPVASSARGVKKREGGQLQPQTRKGKAKDKARLLLATPTGSQQGAGKSTRKVSPRPFARDRKSDEPGADARPPVASHQGRNFIRVLRKRRRVRLEPSHHRCRSRPRGGDVQAPAGRRPGQQARPPSGTQPSQEDCCEASVWSGEREFLIGHGRGKSDAADLSLW